MPYVQELSKGEGVPSEFFNNMGENIAYFRKRRLERQTAVNQLKDSLQSRGLAGSVYGSVDEDGAVNFNLTKNAREQSGASVQEGQKLAERAAYGLQENDMSVDEGPNTTTTVSNADAASKQIEDQRTKLNNEVDKTSYNAGLVAQQAALGLASRAANLKLAPLEAPQLPVQDAIDLNNGINPAKQDAQLPANQGHVYPAGIPLQYPPPETGPVQQTVTPTAQAPAEQQAAPAQQQQQAPNPDAPNTKGSAKASASTKEAVNFSVDGTSDAGSTEKAVKVSTTTTEKKKQWKDDIRADQRELMARAAMSHAINQATGATDSGSMADGFQQLAKQRAADVAGYNEMVSKTGKTSVDDVKMVKIEGQKLKASGSGSVNMGNNVTTNVSAGNIKNGGDASDETKGYSQIKTPSGSVLKGKVEGDRLIINGGQMSATDLQGYLAAMSPKSRVPVSKQKIVGPDKQEYWQYNYKDAATGSFISAIRSPDGNSFTSVKMNVSQGVSSQATAGAEGINKLGSRADNVDSQREIAEKQRTRGQLNDTELEERKARVSNVKAATKKTYTDIITNAKKKE